MNDNNVPEEMVSNLKTLMGSREKNQTWAKICGDNYSKCG